jgi:phosphate:Na+ symporter
MNALALMGGLAGGVGLFLLGMGLMTDGLKLAAGPALERILANSTETRLRALASGVAVTALVQSSSAVTVAAIGFVNAGLLNLSQALWVLFGANVGTTMTGWLVALVGLKFKIEALALPLIGVGMILRLSGERDRRSALGMALAGFGVLFLGIDMLKDTFSGLSTDFNLPAGTSVRDVLVLVLIGIVLTVLMQSSSASLAVALTAAQGGLIAAEGAAAVVIGANVGTTVTALLAAIGATANAKRAAAAHILFNLLTGVVALLLLPWLVTLLGVLRARLHLEAAPAAEVALFHSVFNVLGVVLIWPWATRLTRLLQTRFRSIEEEAGRPRFIDRTVLAVPALALDALAQEIRHLGQLSLATLRAAIEDNGPPRAADARAPDDHGAQHRDCRLHRSAQSIRHDADQRRPPAGPAASRTPVRVCCGTGGRSPRCWRRHAHRQGRERPRGAVTGQRIAPARHGRPRCTRPGRQPRHRIP